MARFPINKKFTESQICGVCKKDISRGKVLPDYSVNIVCDDCFNKYFTKAAKAEKQGFLTFFRPAGVKKDYYRMRDVYFSQEAYEIVVWLIIGAFFALCCLFIGLIYSESKCGAALYIFLPAVIYMTGSFLGGLRAFFRFVGGLFCGMNFSRKLILFAKAAVYLLIVFLLFKYLSSDEYAQLINNLKGLFFNG